LSSEIETDGQTPSEDGGGSPNPTNTAPPTNNPPTTTAGARSTYTNPKTTSAPTSPTRTSANSILQRVQSLTGAAKEVGRDLIANVGGQIGSQLSGGVVGGVKLPGKKENTFYLLIVDDSDTEW
jgi:hypothetical protein